MKKLLCLMIAILMLLSVACTEASVDESSSSADESIIDNSKDTSSSFSSAPESSKVESSKPENSQIESTVSDQTSVENPDESSEPPYIFTPRDDSYGCVMCDHGAVFYRNWFHLVDEPFVELCDPDDQYIGAGVVRMTLDEYRAWLRSETPEEYKFECTIHDTDAGMSDYEYIDPEPYKNKNVVMFVRQFNVDREKLKELYYTRDFYSMYHDFDVLFDWEYQDACNWYLDYYNKYRELLEAKIVLGNTRGELRRRYAPEEKLFPYVSAVQWIYENNIPREEVEGLIENYLTYWKSRNEKLHTGEVVISYKLDDVYNRSDEFMELLEKFYDGEIYSTQLDEWLMDIQYN